MNSFTKLFLVCSAVIFAGCASPQRCHWTVLFNGKSTDAFRGYKRDGFPDKAWKVEDGALKTIPGGEVVDLITKETYGSFELELDWKISPGGNSGIIYHVAETFPQTYNTGPEMQVLDDSKHKDGGNPLTSAGALYALIAPTNKVLEPVGQWNHVRLFVCGNHVEHWLNGRKVVQYQLGSDALNALIAESKFKTMPGFAKEASGHIALQNHHDEVWYRNIRVRRF